MTELASIKQLKLPKKMTRGVSDSVQLQVPRLQIDSQSKSNNEFDCQSASARSVNAKKKTLVMKPKPIKTDFKVLQPLPTGMTKLGSWTPDTKNPLRLEARLKDPKRNTKDDDCKSVKSAASKKSQKYNSKG
jgi:hypothetical protein